MFSMDAPFEPSSGYVFSRVSPPFVSVCCASSAGAAKEKAVAIITKIITRLKMRPAVFIVSCPPISL